VDKYEVVLVKLPRFTSAYEKELNKKGKIEQSDEMYQLFKDQVLLTVRRNTSISAKEFHKALKQVAQEFCEFRKKQRNGEKPPSPISEAVRQIYWTNKIEKKTEKKTKRKRMTREEFLNENK